MNQAVLAALALEELDRNAARSDGGCASSVLDSGGGSDQSSSPSFALPSSPSFSFRRGGGPQPIESPRQMRRRVSFTDGPAASPQMLAQEEMGQSLLVRNGSLVQQRMGALPRRQEPRPSVVSAEDLARL
jgi:hypothetical protein